MNQFNQRLAFAALPGKIDLVSGSYTLPAPQEKTTVAVKIVDMLGEEVLLTIESEVAQIIGICRRVPRPATGRKRPHLRGCAKTPICKFMTNHHSMKYIVTLLGSLAIVTAQADAKPGKGNSGGKGQGKGGNGHSQKADKDKGPDHARKAEGKSDKQSQPAQFARFKDTERNEILDYFGRYQTQGEGLPPGLAMNQRRGKPLPPGWQKKLTPGYRIDDNEWQSYAPVPSDWFPNQRMEPNTRLYHYGDRVVRVYEPRREVVDVIFLPTGR